MKRTLLALAIVLLSVPGALAQPVFRWLTESLPEGTTNAVYTARLLTANADGAVIYDRSSGNLPPGVDLDPQTGLLTGRPTQVNQFNVRFSATDSSQTIEIDVTIKINASGGGGNAGATFLTAALPPGQVGVAYDASMEVGDGVGPYIYGADDLPPGLSLDGLTGAISGTPTAAGTYNVLASCTDRGENDNKIWTIFPLLVLPPDPSTFQFTTVILDNGEIGSAYSHTIETSGANGPVTFAASGLPEGLSMGSDTGEISGTPSQGGTFLVRITATDNSATITTNLVTWIAPSATSDFYWDYFGFPAAILGVEYGRQPPLTVTAVNGTDGAVNYSALGLPPGIVYDAGTGQLSGVPSEIGVYAVTFTATDTDTEETIVLSVSFVVLTPDGGSTNDLPANFWVSKQSIKVSAAGKDSWKASYIYNADRRTGNAFDPATESLVVTLGTREITVAPGSMTDKNGKLSYASAKGEVPAVKITVDTNRQTISVSSTKDTLNESLPGILRNTLVVGTRSYLLDEFFDPKGKFTPTSGLRKVAFVCSSVKASVKAPNEDGISMTLYLGDPAFVYESGVTEVRLKLYSLGDLLVDKDLTALLSATQKQDPKTGATVYKLKSLKDTSETTVLKKFSYDSGKGKMSLSLVNANLAALLPVESHVLVQFRVGNRSYFTSVTLFETKPGSYSTSP